MDLFTFVSVFIAGIALCASHLHHSHDPDSDEHYMDEDHDPKYNGEAFLGAEEDAEEFAALTPDEQIKRLKGVIKKIDTDGDGFITEAELGSWIQKSFKHYRDEDAKHQFEEYDQDGDGLVTWEEYNLQMYDRVLEFDENTELEDYEEESFRKIYLKDKKRFDYADRDGTAGLNVEEFTDFEHPEETEHMLEFVSDGALDEHDKDGDGFVSLEEFLGDYRRDPEAKEDPEWILVEKDRFVNDYDTDGDGKLDAVELLNWILPNDEAIAQEEALHIIEEIDAGGDGKLTEAEIIENVDFFLSSEATDYGRQLHDELFYHDEL